MNIPGTQLAQVAIGVNRRGEVLFFRHSKIISLLLLVPAFFLACEKRQSNTVPGPGGKGTLSATLHEKEPVKANAYEVRLHWDGIEQFDLPLRRFDKNGAFYDLRATPGAAGNFIDDSVKPDETYTYYFSSSKDKPNSPPTTVVIPKDCEIEGTMRLCKGQTPQHTGVSSFVPGIIKGYRRLFFSNNAVLDTNGSWAEIDVDAIHVDGYATITTTLRKNTERYSGYGLRGGDISIRANTGSGKLFLTAFPVGGNHSGQIDIQIASDSSLQFVPFSLGDINPISIQMNGAPVYQYKTSEDWLETHSKVAGIYRAERVPPGTFQVIFPYTVRTLRNDIPLIGDTYGRFAINYPLKKCAQSSDPWVWTETPLFINQETLGFTVPCDFTSTEIFPSEGFASYEPIADKDIPSELKTLNAAAKWVAQLDRAKIAVYVDLEGKDQKVTDYQANLLQLISGNITLFKEYMKLHDLTKIVVLPHQGDMRVTLPITKSSKPDCPFFIRQTSPLSATETMTLIKEYVQHPIVSTLGDPLIDHLRTFDPTKHCK